MPVLRRGRWVEHRQDTCSTAGERNRVKLGWQPLVKLGHYQIDAWDFEIFDGENGFRRGFREGIVGGRTGIADTINSIDDATFLKQLHRQAIVIPSLGEFEQLLTSEQN